MSDYGDFDMRFFPHFASIFIFSNSPIDAKVTSQEWEHQIDSNDAPTTSKHPLEFQVDILLQWIKAYFLRLIRFHPNPQ